jgi:hypothetical protein
LTILALAFACRGGGTGVDEPARLRATLIPPHSDTLRFAVPAAAHLCNGRSALLLEAADHHGNGMLALLRYGDSLRPGPISVIALGDSLTPRGANVAVRYMKSDVAYGLSVDSGSVEVTEAGEVIAARVRGSGLEGGVRVVVDAVYGGVPRPGADDTVPCQYRP